MYVSVEMNPLRISFLDVYMGNSRSILLHIKKIVVKFKKSEEIGVRYYIGWKEKKMKQNVVLSLVLVLCKQGKGSLHVSTREFLKIGGKDNIS